MDSRLAFGLLIASIAIAGVWLTVTGRLLAWYNAYKGAQTPGASPAQVKAAGTAGSAAGAAAASAIGPAPPVSTSSGGASVSSNNGSLTATLGNFTLSGVPTSFPNFPTFNLSQIDGPIGGDGIAIAPITMANWSPQSA